MLFGGERYEALLSQKGERIVKALCQKELLPNPSDDINHTIQLIIASHACIPLSSEHLRSVAYFLDSNITTHTQKHLHVPEDAKCPVCGMFVYKYPKWAAMIEHGGKKYYFDGVKDMMKYYIFDGDFPYSRHTITQMVVVDYYTLEPLDAVNATYVYDSDITGPMGREFVAFDSPQKAKQFHDEHHGNGVLSFKQITAQKVMALDGLEY